MKLSVLARLIRLEPRSAIFVPLAGTPEVALPLSVFAEQIAGRRWKLGQVNPLFFAKGHDYTAELLRHFPDVRDIGTTRRSQGGRRQLGQGAKGAPKTRGLMGVTEAEREGAGAPSRRILRRRASASASAFTLDGVPASPVAES